MDLHSAIRFSVGQLSGEFLSAGSIFSVYSLASTFCVALGALARRQNKRRGRGNMPAIFRAIFAKKLLLRESSLGDAKLLILSVVLMPVVVGGLVVSSNTVAVAVHGALKAAFGPLDPVSFSDPQIRIVSTIVLFLAYEIGYFADHWLKHRVPFLWELHKVHHTADVLTPLVNFRNHPVDNIFFGYMLALFIGGASGVLGWLFSRHTEIYAVDGKNILFLFFLWTIGHLQHSQFWIPFTGVWGRLVLSPAHHQIHHSADPRHFNRNLGSVLAIWDWMAGTLEIPTQKNPRLVYGAPEHGFNPHSSYGLLIAPPLKSAQALWQGAVAMVKSLTGAWGSPGRNEI